MNRPDNTEADILRQYINADRIEKAPEDFTTVTMEMIRLESLPVNPVIKFRKRSLVPVIAILTIIMLISMALILPESSLGSIPKLKFFYDFELPVLDFNFDLIPSLNIPGWFNYFMLGILLLSLLDKALSGFFYKERK